VEVVDLTADEYAWLKLQVAMRREQIGDSATSRSPPCGADRRGTARPAA